MRPPPPTMRAEDVRRDMRDARRARTDAYDSVLASVHRRIVARAGVGATALAVSVPVMVVGMPVIHLADCVAYLLTSLQTDGYTVRAAAPLKVLVSWDPADQRLPKLSRAEIAAAAGAAARPATPAAPAQACPKGAPAVQRAPAPAPPRYHAPAHRPAHPPRRAPAPALALALPVAAWEAFERTQPLRLLAPPALGPPRLAAAPPPPTAPKARAERPPAAARVEYGGAKRGVVLNL